MAWQLYIIPVVKIPIPGGVHNTPAFLPHRMKPATPGFEGIRWSWVTYLNEDVAILAADATSAQHSALEAQASVVAIPLNADSNVGGAAANRVRNELDALNVPADWVRSNDTWRSVIRRLLRIFSVYRRIAGELGPDKLFGGRSKSSRMDALPARVRTGLERALDSMGLDRSLITDATTIETALRDVAEQLPNEPTTLGGIVI